jgi:peptide/nickel transport system substrate-binding protein
VKFDLDQAKKCMAQSKYKDGFAFDLTIPSTAYLLDVRDAALVAQAQLAKIGITAKIKVMEFAPMLSSLIAGNEAASLWIQMSPGEPTYHVQNCLVPGQALHGTTKFQNPEIGKFLKQAFAETDQAKLKPIYDKMALFLAEESPIVWIGFVHAANVWRQRVHDFSVNQGVTLNPKTVKLS